MRMKEFVFFVLLLGTKISYISGSCDSLNVDVKIRHALSLYVLEADNSGKLIKLQVFNNTLNQKWRLAPSRNIGSFNILKVGQNGTALDLGGTFYSNENRFDVALNVFTDAVTQQWFIHANGLIVNGAKENYVLQTRKEDYLAGYDLVVAFGESGEWKFFLDYYN